MLITEPWWSPTNAHQGCSRGDNSSIQKRSLYCREHRSKLLLAHELCRGIYLVVTDLKIISLLHLK